LFHSPALRPAEMIEFAERLSLTAVCYSEKFSCSLKHGLSAAEVRAIRAARAPLSGPVGEGLAVPCRQQPQLPHLAGHRHVAVEGIHMAGSGCC
jgi:hypothetical protein